MKYFFDTEFLEGSQKRFFGKTKPTIDLISIGIVSEDDRSFYAISNEFNLKEAWNVWQQRKGQGDRNNIQPKEYWIRENVLHPVYIDLIDKYNNDLRRMRSLNITYKLYDVFIFNYKNLKWLIDMYGQTNIEIANGICSFIYGDDCGSSGMSPLEIACNYESIDSSKNPEFYAYFASYDWVAFCWLFGKMIDLPRGFPLYCRDLKQMLDDKFALIPGENSYKTLSDKLKFIKQRSDYPKQINEHNALDDAKWDFELYKFLQKKQYGPTT